VATIISAKTSGIKRSPKRRGSARGFSGSLWGEPVMGRENPSQLGS
jgi:hypothetical protein